MTIPALIALLPLLIVLCAMVAFQMGWPVFFCQKRPGRGGKLFTMIKFRSMRHLVDSKGRELPDDQRLTRFGKLLRATSLDELPELFNVLLGQMSLVGPRPLLEKYLELYTPEQARRHDVSPGITGWAQVNGRNAVGWDERFALDTYYVDHLTFALDLKILWMTAATVVNRKGVSAEGHATMPEFAGSESRATSHN